MTFPSNVADLETLDLVNTALLDDEPVQSTPGYLIHADDLDQLPAPPWLISHEIPETGSRFSLVPAEAASPLSPWITRCVWRRFMPSCIWRQKG